MIPGRSARGERSVAVGKTHRVTPAIQSLLGFELAPRGRDGFLVVWAETRGGLYARRLQATGTPTGRAVEVASDRYVMGMTLARDNRRGGYLLVYALQNTELLAQRLDPNGKPFGDPRPVTNAREGGLTPIPSALVYDRTSDGYLLAWAGYPQDFDDRTGEGVYTRRISAAGRPTGSHHLAMAGDAACDIAANRGRAALLACAVARVVYTRPVALGSARPLGSPRPVLRGATGVKLAAARRGYALAARGDRRLAVRPLSASGRPAGAGTSHGIPSGYEGFGPYSLEYSPRHDRVLLTWTGDRDERMAGFFYGGKGQLLDGRGARRVGKRFTIAVRGPGSSAGRHALAPARTGDFVLLTERFLGDATYTLIAQRVIPRR